MNRDYQLNIITLNIQSRLRFRCHLCRDPFHYADNAAQLANHYRQHNVNVRRQLGDYNIIGHLLPDIAAIVRCRPCYGCAFCFVCFSVENFDNSDMIRLHMQGHMNAAPLTPQQWRQHEQRVFQRRLDLFQWQHQRQQDEEHLRQQQVEEEERRRQQAAEDDRTLHRPAQDLRLAWVNRARGRAHRRGLARGGGHARLFEPPPRRGG